MARCDLVKKLVNSLEKTQAICCSEAEMEDCHKAGFEQRKEDVTINRKRTLEQF